MNWPRPSTTSRRAFLLGVAGAAASACASHSPRVRRSAAPSRRGSASTSGRGDVTTTTTTPSGPARFVSTGPSDVHRVALTFHTNGDVDLAHQLLDVLDARNVRVTAFVVGNWLEQHPDWGKRLAGSGHELANHTHTHPAFSDLPFDEMATEITRCRDVLKGTSGSGGRFFRPSRTANGTDTPIPQVLAAAAAAGYRTVLGYDVDPADYNDPGAGAVSARTIAGLHPGAIVSMHFGHAGTIAAMPAILDALDQRGLAAVTVTDLLS